MYNISLSKFRCFEDVSNVAVRPVTFLVGENSAGKTSFLAGLRFLLESMSRRAPNPFNRDPYYLGGFEQIVHYRGGRGGRPQQFDLQINITEPIHQAKRNSDKQYYPLGHHFSFAKGSPQPQLNHYTFTCSALTVAISFEDKMPRATFTFTDHPAPQSVSINHGPPSEFIRENTTFLKFVLDDMAFRLVSPTQARKRKPLAVARDPIPSPLSEALTAEIYRIFRSSFSPVDQQVFSSSPVRTRPLRIYTPSELAASSEGMHVPLELARTKLKSPDKWRSMKEGLVDFGTKSGLFTDIEVRQLGKGDVDPFQVE